MLFFSTARAQLIPTFDYDTIEYRIEYSLEHGLKIKTIYWVPIEPSRCITNPPEPDTLGGIYRDYMVQYPGGTTFYLNRRKERF